MEMLCEEPGIPSKLLKDVLLKNPKDALDIILDDYKQIVKKVGVVHGDLSEFNIIVSRGELYYIDWPQAVPTNYELSNQLIKRDVENILRYFKEKYRIEKIVDINEFFV